MKMIKKKISGQTLTPPKLSGMIAQMASDYISLGETPEERQSYLNSACTAWNIAVLPEHQREEVLQHSIEEYKKANPGIDDADSLLHDVRILIGKKLEMFPTVKTVIINAHLGKLEGNKYQIIIASTDNPRRFIK